MKPKCRLGKRKDKHKNSSRLTGRGAIVLFYYTLRALDLTQDYWTDSILMRLPVILHCNECGYARIAPN
jgi:hypothetical protein